MNINLTPTAHSMEVINRSTLEFDNFEDLKAACDKFDYSIGDIVKIRSNGKIEYRELSETIDLDSILWERSPGVTVYWNLVEVSSRKYTFGTIEEMKKAKYLKVGDVVELNGYYTAGYGAGHKRKIEATDDGSGVQLVNGLWANIVHNGEVNVSWFGAKNGHDYDSFQHVNKMHNYANLENAKCFYDLKKIKILNGNILVKTSTDFNNCEIFFRLLDAPESYKDQLRSPNESFDESYSSHPCVFRVCNSDNYEVDSSKEFLKFLNNPSYVSSLDIYKGKKIILITNYLAEQGKTVREFLEINNGLLTCEISKSTQGMDFSNGYARVFDLNKPQLKVENLNIWYEYDNIPGLTSPGNLTGGVVVLTGVNIAVDGYVQKMTYTSEPSVQGKGLRVGVLNSNYAMVCNIRNVVGSPNTIKVQCYNIMLTNSYDVKLEKCEVGATISANEWHSYATQSFLKKIDSN